MTLPAGALDMQQVRTELGQSGAFSMERLDIRTLAQVSATPGVAWQLSSLRNRTCVNYQVTIGTDTGDNFGWNTFGGYGSTSPGTLQGLTVKTQTFNRAATSSTPAIYMYVNGPPGPNLFYAGMWRNFVGVASPPTVVTLVSAADFNTIVGPDRIWQWAGNTMTNWPSLVGQVVTVQIVY